MSEQDDVRPEERWIEAALASVRSDDVTPPEVVTRLDDRLAQLQAEHQAGRPSPSRRRFGPLLGAAAAVVVIAGVAVPVVRHLDSSTPAGSGSAAGGSAAEQAPASPLSALPALSTRTFATDVRRVLPSLGAVSAQRQGTEGVAPPACAAASSPAPGVRSAQVVQLDGRPALLQVLHAQQGREVVRAVSCSTSRVLAHTSIPAS